MNTSNVVEDKIFWFENSLNNSAWAVNVEVAYVNEESDAFNFYKRNRNTRECPGIIATASQTIQLPGEDFN